MKRFVTLFLSVIMMVSFFAIDSTAIYDEESAPQVLTFNVLDLTGIDVPENNARVTGLITSYGLSVTASGNTLTIDGRTHGTSEVVRSGFKDLTVEYRKNSTYSWEDYHKYGNVYYDVFATGISTTLTVTKGYQYRVTCKHYAKKNLLLVETIENSSNIVNVY